MSEEILEQTAEELGEEQQAVAVSSGEEILDEAKAKVKEEDEDGEEEEEMEEAVSVPKTKAGMIKALYNQLNGMKKSDLSDSFSKIMGSTLAEEEEADEDEEEETPMENKKLKKEDLEIDVKEDIEAIAVYLLYITTLRDQAFDLLKVTLAHSPHQGGHAGQVVGTLLEG